MASRNFYLLLIFRVLLITLSALGVAISWMKDRIAVACVLLIIIIIQTWYLIYFINRTNRKIAYFFDAIRNEDFTLRFPENVTIQSFKELNQSLNRVNELIQAVHKQLQSREQFYRQILSQANIGIMTYNEKGHILYSNPTLERLLNYRPLNHLRQLAMIDEDLYNQLAAHKPVDNFIINLTNEREKYQLVLKSTPMLLDGQAVIVVTIQDIQKQLDEKETDSWLRLIRVLTHEILNTITPITSLSESLLSHYHGNEEEVSTPEMDQRRRDSTIKGLQVIREQGIDLMEFVQSYRSILNLPPPDRTLVNVQNLLDRVLVVMNQHILDSRLRIEVSVIPTDMELFVDERQISQVLVNMMKNAIHALSDQENGLISIRAWVLDDGSKLIELADNGPGIPPELLDQVFVPFFTTKESGTGVGLSLSRQIVHLNGGTMNVESVPGVQTVFVMKFQG